MKDQADHGLPADGRLNRGGVAWSIFEGGRDPFVILITIYGSRGNCNIRFSLMELYEFAFLS